MRVEKNNFKFYILNFKFFHSVPYAGPDCLENFGVIVGSAPRGVIGGDLPERGSAQLFGKEFISAGYAPFLTGGGEPFFKLGIGHSGYLLHPSDISHISHISYISYISYILFCFH